VEDSPKGRPPLSSGVTTPTAVGEPGLLDKESLGTLTDDALLSMSNRRKRGDGKKRFDVKAVQRFALRDSRIRCASILVVFLTMGGKQE
jgi:hypothetical protein